jgi:iron complex outermembrane receptor protein
MFSQEFRLNGSSESLDWFIGASFVKEDLSFRNDLRYDEFAVADIFGLNALDVEGDACNGTIDFGDGNGPVAVPPCITASEIPSGNGETESVAVYGDFTRHLGDRWGLAGGVRYTNDDNSLTYDNPSTGGLRSAFDPQIFGWITPGPQQVKQTYNSTDPRLALNFHVSDGTMLYVSGAKGYKSGGLNRQYDPVAQAILPFDKEESTAYELGIKSTFFRGRGQINAAIFKNNYDNFQLEELINLVPQVRNVGDAEVTGLDMDFRFLLSEAFEIWGSLALLDSELSRASDPTTQGNAMPMAPDTTGSLSGKWSKPVASGEMDLSATWTYSDTFFFDLANTLQQPSYSTVAARAAWANDTWGIALIGENLTDEEYLTGQFVFLDISGVRAPGRLLRVEAHLNF